MRKYSECEVEMKEFQAKTPKGIGYNYFKCSKCGEEIVDMKQLHAAAEECREMKILHKLQQTKMKELWDNKEDESWEK